MNGYRIANFVMQLVCVLLHLLFILGFLRRRQSTPIWRWFLVVTVGLWMLISGRFMESIAYLFLPSNAFYTFAVYWQFVGTTYSTFAYLFWNLHLAGLERAAESKPLRIGLFTVSTAFCLVICTNYPFKLFYEKIVMGESVVHGPMHTPWIVWVYGMLFVGYIISVVNIIRTGKEKLKRIAVFSMFPLFPAITALIRSISGVDELDYTPIVVAISVFCMYLIVFRRNYVNLIPQSIESALEQTESALVVYNRESGEIEYKNRSAEAYAAYLPDILQRMAHTEGIHEETFDSAVLHIRISDFGNGSSVLFTITDITSLIEQRRLLKEEIETKDAAIHELEDKRRNINAYLEALYRIPDLKEKQELFAATKEKVIDTFAALQKNMERAADNIPECERLLTDNIETSKATLSLIRSAVAKMKEDMR